MLSVLVRVAGCKLCVSFNWEIAENSIIDLFSS